MKTIYIAGGCFWGVQMYFNNILGVVSTKVGYAQSKKVDISYEEVCSGLYGAVEAVKIQYSDVTSITTLLEMLFKVIDPTALNRQGNDIGIQYRSGVYYEDEADKVTIEQYINEYQMSLNKKIATEVQKIENFYDAQEYHQNYLEKNPGGYCHINLSSLKS